MTRPPPEAPEGGPPLVPPLFAGADPDATPAQRIAAVHAFTTRCRAWAIDAIARRREAGRAADDWELYLRFTEHTLEELENGTLDHWFVDNP